MVYQGKIAGTSYNNAKVNAVNMVQTGGFEPTGKTNVNRIDNTMFHIGNQKFDMYNFTTQIDTMAKPSFKLHEIARINATSTTDKQLLQAMKRWI